MNKHVAFLLFFVQFAVCQAYGQASWPTINPMMSYADSDGNQQTEATSITESAPLTVSFSSGTEHAEGWTAHYEWRFYRQGQRDSPYVVRYDEDTEFTFSESGAHLIELWATFVNGNDTINYTDDYWTSEATPLSVSIYESKLEFPNAFSPNGDGINDIYKAKDGYKSITEFHATIYNRWGQRIYSWNDPSAGWDGKYNGKDVSQGVYFLLVKARGADGRRFNIKKDINLLRGYTETQATK
ncbi:MAG TPA: gliding motility protein [Prevotella sp.]|nr:gliding motility protein [Prevotella sp.]